jgi:hypothetical protein
MSAALGTELGTYRSWKYRKSTPPGAIDKLLTLFEKHPCVRKLAGATREKQVRGKPFAPGHCYRFGDPRRPQALKEARAKRKAKTNGSQV